MVLFVCLWLCTSSAEFIIAGITSLFIFSTVGDNLEMLLTVVLRGQQAKHRASLINQVPPKSLEPSAYIRMTKHNNVFYVVYPTGQTYPFQSALSTWMFYVKSLFVFNAKYETNPHVLIGMFYEKLLKVPNNLLSTTTSIHIKQLLKKVAWDICTCYSSFLHHPTPISVFLMCDVYVFYAHFTLCIHI